MISSCTLITMKQISRTVIAADNASDGLIAAQALVSTFLNLANTSKTSFEDPDFGPELTERGAELEDEINFSLKKQLSDRAYQTIVKTFNKAIAQRTKLLHNIVGPSGKIPHNLEWVSNPTETSFVVSPNTTPSFPVQGSVGDCWLLGAMSMIAVSRPNLLQEIFVCPEGTWSSYDKRGRFGSIPMSTRNIYVVRLFHELKWHYVIIDGRVPRGHTSGRPTFGRCADSNEMWVSLIEKAAAKLVGGYDKLHMAGTIDFGLHMLTGCSTHTIRGGGFNATLQQEGATSGNTTNSDKGSDNSADATITKLVEKETSKTSRNVLYKQIKQYVEAGFVVGCERFSRLGQMDLTMKSPSAKATFTDEDGVLIRHAYVVVDMGEINGTQLVRIVNPWMVNPWPTGQYFKEWSRNSKQHEQVEENNAAIHSTFGTAKVRRHTNTNVMMQYVPGYQTGFGSSNNKESKGSDGEEEEDEENNDDNTDASDSSFTTPYDFLMPFDHFCESMSHIHIGFIAPLDPSSWTIRSVTGKWAARVGGCATPVDLEKWSRNPRYKLDVPEPNVTVEELERRKRSQVNKKTNVTNVIVSLRQSVRLSSPNASPLDTTLGLRFVPCGKSIVPTIVENTVPGRAQPYHIEGTGAASVSLNLKCDSALDIVPDNYRVGAIADFQVTVVSYLSKIELKRALQPESGKNKSTTSKVGVVLDRDPYDVSVQGREERSEMYDVGAVPFDRVPPSKSNVMRGIRKKRERDQIKIIDIIKNTIVQKFILNNQQDSTTSTSNATNGTTKGKGAANQTTNRPPTYSVSPDQQFEEGLNFWKKKQGGTATSKSKSKNGKLNKKNAALPPPSYQTVLKKQETNGHGASNASSSLDENALPPPPPYTRVVTSPERAALREKIQQSLLESPPSQSNQNKPTQPYFGGVIDMEEESHCAVVFRGGLMMQTMDCSPASKMKGMDEVKTTAFVLCTVQEIVHPYALIFSVEHPGTRTSASRKFDLKNLEQMLTSPLSMTATQNINQEAMQAVDSWFETGVLPRHDHLATWLAVQMDLDLGGGGIHVESIDGPINPKEEDENEDENEDPKSNYVLHDVKGMEEEASVASSWEEEGGSQDEGDDPFASAMNGGGDESFAPDEWNSGGGDQDTNNENQMPKYEERKPDSGARLPDSDPFVLASLHAGAVLKDLQEKDSYRKRVAEVREEVILQRARKLRAASEYQRDVSRLQHEEIGKAIMRQTVAIGVASTLKKSDVNDTKRKVALGRLTNPFKHNPSQKWIRGPNLGEGPLPSRTLDLPRQQKRLARERSKYAYDSHGRKLPKKILGKSRTGPPVEAAMNKLRDAAKKNGVGYLEIKNLYNEFDTEKNGFLSHGELKAAMKSLKVEMNADEMKALIRHFDSNGNGTIHYSEFSFAFFNRRSLINKWRQIKGPGMRSEQAIMSMFRKYDFDGSGKLEKDEFERCLRDMGIKLGNLEFQILAERFDTDGDGFVQPSEFINFMKELEKNDQKEKKDHRSTITSSQNGSNALLNEIKMTAVAGASSVHPDIKALQSKIKAQEEEIETLERFMSRRK